jgi:phosphate transport system permease protein
VNRTLDRIGIGVAWISGLFLLVVIAGLVLWLAWNGIRVLSLDFLWSDPAPGSLEAGLAGGIRFPLAGTLIVMLIGSLIALPVGVATAIFLAEYRRPAWLASAVEGAVEIVFGVPAIVFALFGLAVFTSSNLAFMSQRVESSGAAYGRSFLIAGTMLSLIALPPIVRSTQEAIRAVPPDLREASFALGKGRLATIRRVLIPGATPGIATGFIIGLGRIAGDTAIIVLLLGNVIQAPIDHWAAHPGDTLTGAGATLTSYIYNASPVGEGNSDSHAYGAAFVLIMLMLVLNGAVLFVSRRGAWKR